MADRIDHLAEAQGLLSFAVSDQAETSSKPKDVFDMATTRAQVHATLALVEQQRATNLLLAALLAAPTDTHKTNVMGWAEDAANDIHSQMASSPFLSALGIGKNTAPDCNPEMS